MPRRSERASKGKRLKVEGDDEVGSSSVGGARKGKEDCGAAAKGEANGRTRSAEEVEEGTSGSSATTETTTGQNPLENPVILNHLFGLCTTDVLATCRQVCKLWYNESLLTWRTSCSITFTVKRGSIFLTNRNQNPNALYVPLKKFLAYIETPSSQCSTKPYRYIKIVDCELTFGLKQFEEFWSAMANNVTALVLIQCKFSDVEDFRKIIFQTCPNLNQLAIDECSFPAIKDLSVGAGCAKLEYKAPLYGEHKHLKELQIVRGMEILGDNYSLDVPVSWLDFFSHFQSLTSFVFDGYNTPFGHVRRVQRWYEIDLLTEAIQLVRKQGKNKLPFRHFFVYPPYYFSRENGDKRKLEIARELHIPVSFLIIDVHPELDEYFLTDTLNINAKTIKSIELYQEAPTVRFRAFPFEVQLNNLVHLGFEDKLFDSFTFLKYTPNLETLFIFVDEDMKRFGEYKYETPTSAVGNTPKEELEHVRMEQLTALHLGVIVGDEDISSLFHWMPKVVELEMILNDKQFGIICETWRDLTKLKVHGDKLTDKGVTGRSDRRRQTKQKGKTGTVALLPNITYLQKLEEFSFMSSNLTADSVFHGFLGLPKLQRIQSSFSTQMIWGKAAKNALKKKKIHLEETSDE